MLNKLLYISLLMCFLVINGKAQSFTASVNKKKVPVNQDFTLTYKIQADVNSFTPPDLNKFQLLSGPNQSSSMTIVNGKVSRSVTLSYKLKSKNNKTGVVQIGPATIQSGGKNIKSNAVSLEFTKASKQSANPQNDITAQLDKSIDLVLSVNKSELYVGEQMVATYKLFFNADITQLSDYVKNPAFNSFWTQDFELGENSVQVVEYKGGRYNMSVIKKVLLTPQKAGDLEIESMGIELLARVRTNSRRFGFFGNYKNVKHKVYSRSKKIKVKALPKSGKNEAFNGAVGNFTINSELSKTEAEANEAISLKIVVKGNGNLKLFDSPTLDIPPDIETYEPKISEKITMTNNGNSGSKIFEYVLIPRYAGEYKIPSVAFSYFDLEKKKYINLKTPDYLLKISGEEKSESANKKEISYSNKDEITLLGEDVLFIKTSSDSFRNINSFYFRSGLFYFFIFAPLLLIMATITFFKKYRSLNEDMAYVKRRRANSLTKKRLSIAKKHLIDNNLSDFYEELSKAIWGYFSDKMNIPFSEISKEKIEELLREKEVDILLREELTEIIDQCEFARFASGSVSQDLNDVYDKAANIITKIDVKI